MSRGTVGRSPANISKYLKDIRFPAHKADLLRHAKREGAKEPVLGVIENLPDGNYVSMADVMTGVGKVE
jgi:hypothetical protein